MSLGDITIASAYKPGSGRITVSGMGLVLSTYPVIPNQCTVFQRSTWNQSNQVSGTYALGTAGGNTITGLSLLSGTDAPWQPGDFVLLQSSGASIPSATLSAIFDAALGSTQGNIPIRGASLWGVTGAIATSNLPTVGLELDAFSSLITADTDGATITFNCALSNWHSVTLGGNRTLALSNVGTNQQITLRLQQDATGSRTVTWFSTIKWAGGSPPTLTTTAGKADTFTFKQTAANAYDGFVVGQNI